jgi:hypothetical protein
MPLVRICAGWRGATLFPTAIVADRLIGIALVGAIYRMSRPNCSYQIMRGITLALLLNCLACCCSSRAGLSDSKLTERQIHARSSPSKLDGADNTEEKLPIRVTNAFFNRHHGLVGFPNFLVAIKRDGTRQFFSMAEAGSAAPSNRSASNNLLDWFRTFEARLSETFIPQAYGAIRANIRLSRGKVESISFFGFQPGFMGKVDETSLEVPMKSSVVSALGQAVQETAAEFPEGEVEKLEIRLKFAGDPSGHKSYGCIGD